MTARFTEKQGQYLAFIYNYTVMFSKPPSEWEFEKFFRVAPSTVHQMILKLTEKELISRLPGQARSIKLLVDPDEMPRLLIPHKGRS